MKVAPKCATISICDVMKIRPECATICICDAMKVRLKFAPVCIIDVMNVRQKKRMREEPTFFCSYWQRANEHTYDKHPNFRVGGGVGWVVLLLEK